MAEISAPFATVTDLEARWRPLSGDEAAIAGNLIADASSLIVDEVPSAATVPDGDVAAWLKRTATLKRIVCAMVKRAMISAEPGVASRQETVGPFSGMSTYANPTGDLYLTKSELRSLRGADVFEIDLIPATATVPSEYGWAGTVPDGTV